MQILLMQANFSFLNTIQISDSVVFLILTIVDHLHLHNGEQQLKQSYFALTKINLHFLILLLLLIINNYLVFLSSFAIH